MSKVTAPLFALLLLLAPTTLPASAAEECDVPVCFGTNWQTATVVDIRDVDVNARDENGGTPLMWAASSNQNPDVIRALLDAGADVGARNNWGSTALMWAASWNQNPDAIRVLLNAGANVGARTDGGSTALMKAASHNENPEIARLLLQAGADIGARDGDGQTALMQAATSFINTETFRFLLKAGADIGGRDKNGWTPLMLATGTRLSSLAPEKVRTNIEKTRAEKIRTLIDMGADTEDRDNRGNTALMLAAQKNEMPVIQALIEGGADVNAYRANITYRSIISSPEEWFRNLVNKIRGFVPTVLMLAARHNPDSDVILALLDAGADPHCDDVYGKTAWDYIQENEALKNTDAYWKLNELRY